MKDVIRETALALGIKPKNLQKWKERGAVPYKWQRRLADEAKKAGKRITWSDMSFRDVA